MLRNLLDVAPAGLEDLAAFSVLTDALVQERFKRIVVDPVARRTGVRLVELPGAAHGLADRAARGAGRSTGPRAWASSPTRSPRCSSTSSASRMRWSNPAEARFVVVTRGEELAAARTERLVEELKGKKLAVERVLVNRVLPKTTCPAAEDRRRQELDVAKTLEKKIGLPVTVAPALGRHPAGLRELKSFRTAWYALSATQVKPGPPSAPAGVC